MKDSFEGEHVFQLELKGLRHTLEWTQLQRECLLDQLDLLRLENQRLQDRIGDLERLVDELKQQERLF
jgi:regulator of replication initiation timing